VTDRTRKRVRERAPKRAAPRVPKRTPAKSSARTPHDAAREAFRSDLRLAAERVFAQKGFAATKMNDIAREAKVAVGTLYNYFPSKEHIFSELCTVLGSAFYAQLGASLSVLSPLAKLEQFVRTSLDYIDQHGALFALFVERGAVAEVDIPRVGGSELAAQHQRFLSLLETIVQGAVAAGELREDVPVGTMLAVLSGAMNGATYAWFTHRFDGRLSDVASDLLSLFLTGARKPA
jgi:AcrR family transcriptional regulator